MRIEVISLKSRRRQKTDNSSHNLRESEKAEQCTTQRKEISGVLNWGVVIKPVHDILDAYLPFGRLGFGRDNEDHHYLFVVIRP